MKKILEKLPDILLAQLAAFCLVYGLTSSLLLTYPAINILLFCMLFVVLLYLLLYNKITSTISMVLLGVSILSTLLYVSFGTGLGKVITFFDDYFYWLGDFIQYPEVPDPLFQSVTVIFLAVFLSVFTYIFFVRKFQFLVIAISGIGLFAVQWSYDITTTLVPFYLYLAITLVCYLKYIYLKKVEKTENEYSGTISMTLWSLPVSILILAIAFSFHASNKPIEWKWLDKKIVSVYNYINKKLDYETFDYFSLSSSSGFGDRSNLLGGRVRLDRTNVLRVSTSRNTYLKGVVLDTYTGTRWTNGSNQRTQLGNQYGSIYSDTGEMITGMELLTGDKNFLNDYFLENRITVTFLNLKTKSLFLPAKPAKFAPQKSVPVFSDRSGSLSTSQRLSKGFSYNVTLYTPDIGSDEFAKILKNSRRGLYSDYLLKADFPSYYQAVSEFKYPGVGSTTTVPAISTNTSTGGVVVASGAQTVGELSNQRKEEIERYQKIKSYKEKSESIYKTYLQLPQNLPQRVKDLATSLAANSKTDYEKAKAIEQYLSKNFPYNLDVRSTPRNRDFVDYFLFDLKQGYCSYYASAMAVLARCADLPARYVEGYMLPPEPLKDNKTTYIVTNMQAHAWVEIYFEGYGWLPFEPTSPFLSNFYSSEKSEAVISSSYNSSYEDYMEMMKRYGGDRDPGDLSGIAETKEKLPAAVFVLIGVAILITAFAALLLFNLTRNRLRLYKITNMPAKECILKFYDYYINVLSLLDLGLIPAETPAQYSGRIDKTMFFSPVRFKIITDIFMKARYSLKDTSEKEKLLYCEFHQGFLDEVKINMGKTKYFFFKYILGRF